MHQIIVDTRDEMVAWGWRRRGLKIKQPFALVWTHPGDFFAPGAIENWFENAIIAIWLANRDNNCDLMSNSPTFYKQLLCAHIPKAPKRQSNEAAFWAFGTCSV